MKNNFEKYKDEFLQNPIEENKKDIEILKENDKDLKAKIKKQIHFFKITENSKKIY